MESNIRYITLMLSLIAGFCDTATFVSADALFSAHVTGNFIVSAYQLVKGSDLHAWIKLLSFPVFILAVIAGGRIGLQSAYRYHLLLLEGILLSVAGSITIVLYHSGLFTKLTMYIPALMVVCAMGLQNAFGKLYPKELYGPTTMMTGNVTQAALDIGSLLRGGIKNNAALQSLKKQAVMLVGFLIGCCLGALAGSLCGLTVILIPGLALIACYFSGGKTQEAMNRQV